MLYKTQGFYEFSDFRLDARSKILYHGDAPVALKPKVVETLVVLIENAGEVVGKTDLMNAVWQDSFVEENNLSVNIYALRKAFARLDGEKNYIQTVPRRGFRFAVPVKKIAAESPLSLVLSSSSCATNNFAEDAPLDTNDEPLSAAQSQSTNAEQTRDKEQRTNHENRKPKTENRNHFAGWNLAAAILIIFSVFTVGGALYVIRENRRQPIEAKNAGASNDNDEIERRGTKNIEAYQFYMRGRELWETRENPKMDEGILFFRRAIELDPNFAAPYLGIADSLSMMRNDAGEWRAAEEYALKALKLAPDSAEACATLGFIYAMNKWQWQAAEDSFQKALTFDSHSGKAHQWYATLLMIERRFDEAETHLKRAVEIEPMSPLYNADLCEFYTFAARDKEALAQCRRTNEIKPDFLYAFSEKGILIRQRRYDEAAQVWLKTTVRMGLSEAEARNAGWYRAFKKDGFRGWMLDDIERHKKSEDTLLGAWNIATSYAVLGDREKTLEYLEKTFAGRTFLLPFANARPEFDFLRGDARFQDLMRRIGLAQ